MLALTAPADCPLSARWGYAAPPPRGNRNVVRVVGKRIGWNEVPIDLETLALYSKTVGGMKPQPVLILEVAAAADCVTLRRVAAWIEANAACTPRTCLVSDRPLSHRERNLPPAHKRL